MRLRALVLLAPLGLPLVGACGPQIEVLESSTAANDDGTTAADPSGSTSPAITVGSTTTTSDGPGDTTEHATTTGEPPGGYEDDDGGTGCTFTCPDPPPSTGGGGGPFFECDLLAQDCPEDEKCMPWANDGGSTWNATRCSPVADAPGLPGELCQVRGSGVSGIDDCELGSVCWNVDPATNQGTCHALCPGPGQSLACQAEQICAPAGGFVSLCVSECDPLAPSCGPGTACLPSGSAFSCQPHDGLGAAVGEPCDAPNACVTGSLCAFDPAITCGNVAGQGCCAAPCDVNAPGSCGGPMSICVPWFPLRPPPDLTHLGVCAEP